MKWLSFSEGSTASFELTPTLGMSFLQLGVVWRLCRCATTLPLFLGKETPRLNLIFCRVGGGGDEEGLHWRVFFRVLVEWNLPTYEDFSHASTVLTTTDGMEKFEMSQDASKSDQFSRNVFTVQIWCSVWIFFLYKNPLDCFMKPLIDTLPYKERYKTSCILIISCFLWKFSTKGCFKNVILFSVVIFHERKIISAVDIFLQWFGISQYSLGKFQKNAEKVPLDG